MPNNKILKKGLVVGIIVLFVGVSVLSSVSSKDISLSDEEILECDIELKNNPVTSPINNYREIITGVDGVLYKNVPNKNIQPSLEVIIEVVGNGRTFHLTTYISNNGDENVTIMLICFPGGGFEIYNQNEELVYNSPKIVFWIMWELSLEAFQTEEIFNETWKGVNNNWKNLPSGNYSVRGVVFTDEGDIFSEPVEIYLEKAKNKNILSFLERFPLLNLLLQILRI